MNIKHLNDNTKSAIILILNIAFFVIYQTTGFAYQITPRDCVLSIFLVFYLFVFFKCIHPREGTIACESGIKFAEINLMKF